MLTPDTMAPITGNEAFISPEQLWARQMLAESAQRAIDNMMGVHHLGTLEERIAASIAKTEVIFRDAGSHTRRVAR